MAGRRSDMLSNENFLNFFGKNHSRNYPQLKNEKYTLKYALYALLKNGNPGKIRTEKCICGICLSKLCEKAQIQTIHIIHRVIHRKVSKKPRFSGRTVDNFCKNKSYPQRIEPESAFLSTDLSRLFFVREIKFYAEDCNKNVKKFWQHGNKRCLGKEPGSG